MELPFKELTHKAMTGLWRSTGSWSGFLEYIYHRALHEIKAKSDLDNSHLAQGINYIEASNFPAGLLINFGAPSLQFKRLHNKFLFPPNADKSGAL